jgi:ADP-ribosyl-[dinitrogen reductase] hydrolase
MASSQASLIGALRLQNASYADAGTKIRLSILATALVDALGGPPEFHTRFTFPLVTKMTPNQNFGLPPGVWTDDTSMTLCLGRSIATYTPKGQGNVARQGGFDEADQLGAYSRWRDEGVLSAIGRCFDIGNTIAQALSIYADYPTEPGKALAQIRLKLSGEYSAGNGSLMRILPVGLAYWRDEQAARTYGRRSSETTHPTSKCLEACEMWTGAITKIMRATTEAVQYTKLDLIEYISSFPYQSDNFRSVLTFPDNAPPRPDNKEELEAYYQEHHPLLRLIKSTQEGVNIKPEHIKEGFSYALPTVQKLPSTGYVVHTLVAALYCFFATKTFEEGAIMAVNLGSDADTVGAVYAGLAGCWYAAGEDSEVGRAVFWSERVKDWREGLVKRELVEQVADELVTFQRTAQEGSKR